LKALASTPNNFYLAHNLDDLQNKFKELALVVTNNNTETETTHVSKTTHVSDTTHVSKTTPVSETTHVSKTTPSTTVATDMGPNYRLSLNDTFNFLKPNNVTTTQSVPQTNTTIKEENITFSIDETLKKFIKDKLDVISSSEDGSTPTKSKFTCGEI